jgi:hypothetical protein
VTEYLFRNEELLNEVIDTAIDDNTFRSDDLEFTFAARVRICLYCVVPPEVHVNFALPLHLNSTAASLPDNTFADQSSWLIASKCTGLVRLRVLRQF